MAQLQITFRNQRKASEATTREFKSSTSVAPKQQKEWPSTHDILHRYSAQSWAPNIWRIRFILNYKRLPYTTVWVEFADVETTLRSIGAPPSVIKGDGRPVYSLPVLVDPTKTPYAPVILSNANNIAEYLESAYPSPAVFPAGSRALQSLFAHYIQEVFAKPLLPIMVPISHQQLSDRNQRHLRNHPSSLSAAYTSQGDYLINPLPPGPQREQAWLAVKEQFDFIDAIMAKNNGDGDGIVVMGRDHRQTGPECGIGTEAGGRDSGKGNNLL
ncbi:hypothetical protein EV360DRAFT_66617 [Lentinula raphanica]|nr:hypothetical protein EV360DRAFT_66617 [Lentinula raphanica]